MQLRQSQRREAKMRLVLQGASGSGKTYSSLLIAYCSFCFLFIRGSSGSRSPAAFVESIK